LYSIATYLMKFGPTEEDIKIGLWNLYKRDLAVQTIKNTAKVFKKFEHIHLTERDFPVDTNYNYSYRSTWGDRRGFGGIRIHEGTDIFEYGFHRNLCDPPTCSDNYNYNSYQQEN